MVEVDAIKSKKDINKVKKYLYDSNIRDYVCFVVGVNTGLRASDLLNLKWSDVMDAGNIKSTVQIVEIKTGKIRLVTLNNAVVKALDEYRALGDCEGYIFKSRKGDNQPITVRSLNSIIKQATIGIKGNYGTHSIRKSFGYHSYVRGISVDVLQKVFGHSSSAITLRYIGIDKQVISDVYSGLDL